MLGLFLVLMDKRARWESRQWGCLEWGVGLLEWNGLGVKRKFLYLQATHPKAQLLEEQPGDWNALGQTLQP